ncbi:MAG: MATE family efflux transporter [Suipraeoptans sp.]
MNNTNKKQLDFTTGSIPKSMLIFVGPYLLGVLLQNLYGAVDLFVVGHYAATADVSAVTIGSQLMSVITQLIIGFATGITIRIGLAFGARDSKSLSKIIGNSIIMFSSIAILIMTLYITLRWLLVDIMQTPAEAVSRANEYLFICALGIPFIVGYNVITAIMTGLGDSKKPFIFVSVACIINIVLDIVLVRYIGLGALGAAIATTVAQAGSFVFAIVFLKINGLGCKFSKSDIRIDTFQLKHIIKVGAPVAIQNVMVGISFLFVTAIINQMGLIASAAVGVVEKLIVFLFVPATSFATAVGTASSQNLGAGEYKRTHQSMWCGILMSLVPSLILFTLCQINGPILTGIFTKNKEVIDIATNYLHSYIFDIILVSFVFSMNGYFNSLGKSWFSLLHSLLTTFAIRIPVAFILSRLENTSLFLIGWAAPASTLVSLLMCLLFLHRIRRTKQ